MLKLTAVAGLAVTPLPKHTIAPRLRILGKKDNLPSLPNVLYVLQTGETETRQTVGAFAALIRESATGASVNGQAGVEAILLYAQRLERRASTQ
jgi:hypothetical protein